jgi:hypothetical protein
MMHELSDIVPLSGYLNGWVNGNLYHQTDEQFGIVPISHDLIKPEITGMLPFDKDLPASARYQFLAQQQGTKFAVTTVCHLEEQKLFGELKKSFKEFI